MAKLVYLCGPITGQSYEAARNGWRRQFSHIVGPNIQCLSPMRAKSYLEGIRNIEGSPEAYADMVLSTDKGIVTRDRFDTMRSDMVVANFLDAPERASIGSCIEFGWADAARVPLVMIVQPGKEREAGDPRRGEYTNIHQHAMLVEMAGFIVHTVEEAAATVKAVLTPGI